MVRWAGAVLVGSEAVRIIPGELGRKGDRLAGGEGREVDATEPSPIQMWGVVIDAHVPTESKVIACGSSLALPQAVAPLPQLLSELINIATDSGGFLPVKIHREGGEDLFVVTPQGDLVPASQEIDSAGFDILSAGRHRSQGVSELESIASTVSSGVGNGWIKDEGPYALVTVDEQVDPGASGHERAADQGSNSVLGREARPVTRREVRESFLTQDHIEEPATKGVRGVLTKMGIRLKPSASERAERDDVAAVSQHWPGPRTIAIANPKGGVGKTPTTAVLSAVFARYGGAGVLAWDNNQTRGTLGWRTEQGPHEATLLDLLPQIPALLSTGAQSADLAHYVHHQTRDRFDVLRSKPTALANEQRLHPEDVDAIHSVASKYYRLVFIDSGNDESDPMWLRMIDHADQLVVASTTRDDHAEAGALMLEALAERDERGARLAQGAVAVISQADPKASGRDVQRVTDGYRALAREAVAIPFDPAIVDGILRYGSLQPRTQRAWLKAAAAVAGGL